MCWLNAKSVPASLNLTRLLLRHSQNLDEELHPMIANLEQSNALALAIVEPGMY